MEQIKKKDFTLRKVSDQNKNDKKLSNNENTNLIKNAFENLHNSSMLEVTKSLDSESDDKDDDQNRTYDSEWEDSTPSTPQSEGKPLVPPKTAGLQTKSEASPGVQTNNVDQVNSEVQKPSSFVIHKVNP
ncbi:hypothetical protein wTpre_220 [Wolbachia endosymbiont of Trichogramma pretiosum]|nr:hypothetical protein wTpre_220 [Wolbachia endosymbiont of Trichogramma pretiosum]